MKRQREIMRENSKAKNGGNIRDEVHPLVNFVCEWLGVNDSDSFLIVGSVSSGDRCLFGDELALWRRLFGAAAIQTPMCAVMDMWCGCCSRTSDSWFSSVLAWEASTDWTRPTLRRILLWVFLRPGKEQKQNPASRLLSREVQCSFETYPAKDILILNMWFNVWMDDNIGALQPVREGILE